MTQEPTRLLSTPSFQDDLDQAIANAVCETIKQYMGCSAEGLGFILKALGVNYRFNFKRGGCDINMSRVNVTTDNKNTVTAINLG